MKKSPALAGLSIGAWPVVGKRAIQILSAVGKALPAHLKSGGDDGLTGFAGGFLILTAGANARTWITARHSIGTPNHGFDVGWIE